LSEAVALLDAGPAGVDAIASALGISKAAATKRLQALANRGIVLRDGGQGIRTTYRLSAK
jgi:predicted transcriptional regulator